MSKMFSLSACVVNSGIQDVQLISLRGEFVQDVQLISLRGEF
jgi:phage gp45-like